MMKRRIVLVEFPYDDLSDRKLRPAYCLTDPVGEHRHIILALITSRIPPQLLETDMVLEYDASRFLGQSTQKTFYAPAKSSNHTAACHDPAAVGGIVSRDSPAISREVLRLAQLQSEDLPKK